MKVYVKKENKNTIIQRIAIMISFFLFSIGIFIHSFTSEKSFGEILISEGCILLMCAVFFGFSMYFLFILIKRPKSYKAKLINKELEIYNGKQITYMKFNVEKKRKQEEDLITSDYYCYSIGENDLNVGQNYSLKIKEFNWEPKYVEEINLFYESSKNKVKDQIPNMTVSPVFFILSLFFVGNLFFCILGMIMYHKYISEYIIVGIFFLIALFITVKAGKEWKADNNIEPNNQNFNLKLEKIKPIENKQEKVGNIVIRHLFILFIAFSLFWFIMIMSINTNLNKKENSIMYSMGLIAELPIVIMILYNIGYDNRLIKRYKINIQEDIFINNIKYFNIFRPTKNATFLQYFIIDNNKNLILKIKESNFAGNKFVICDQHNIKIGEIASKWFSLTNEFTVNIIDEEPFIIRSKLQMHSNCQIIGRNYYVKGDANLIRNIIYDNNENAIAYISATSKNDNSWYELGSTEIELNDDVINSVDIMIIALCITMGNFQTLHREIDR